MRRFRFHIGSLVILVLLLGVGLAALRESNETWDSSIFSLTLLVLLISILLAVHRTESRRAFWTGFALFGWTYIGLSLLPSVEPRLITTKAFHYLDSQVPGRSLGVFTLQVSGGRRSGAPGSPVPTYSVSVDGRQLGIYNQGSGELLNLGTSNGQTGRFITSWSGTTDNFVRIGHSLFALLVGWFGGQLSRGLSRTSRSSEPSAAVNVGGTNS